MTHSSSRIAGCVSGGKYRFAVAALLCLGFTLFLCALLPVQASAAEVSASTSVDMHRLYNPNAGDHHYTTSTSERDYLMSIGWNDEGIGQYSDDAQGVPLYRQYNPNAYSCNHNYTTSEDENDWLVSLGWKAEGIAWYGVQKFCLPS